MKKLLPTKRQILVLLFLSIIFILIYYFYQKNKDASEVGNAQAKWADDLVDSIGVNTHLSWGGYNFKTTDLKKFPTTPSFVRMICYGGKLNPERTKCLDPRVDYFNVAVYPNPIDGKYFLDYDIIRDNVEKRNERDLVFNNLSKLLQESGIRHIRDTLDNPALYGLVNYSERLSTLQNPTDKTKVVKPNLITSAPERGFDSFCKNNKHINGKPEYLLDSYPYCDLPPVEQVSMCIRDEITALKNGGAVPDCMVVQDPYYYSRYFDSSSKNPDGTYPLKERPKLVPISLDSIEGVNEWDGAGAYNGRFEITIPWRNNAKYYFNNWFDALSKSEKNNTPEFPYPPGTPYNPNSWPFGKTWYEWTVQHTQSIKSALNQNGKLSDFVSPTLSWLYYYDIPYQRQVLLENQIQINNINTKVEIDAAIQLCSSTTTPESGDACLETELRKKSDARSIAMKNAVQEMVNTADIANQHIYCAQDWPLTCLTDRTFDPADPTKRGEPYKLNNLDMGIDKLLSLYMRDQLKSLYITEWNYPSYHMSKDFNTKITISDITKYSLIDPAAICSGCYIANDKGKAEELVQNKYIQRGIFDNFKKSKRNYIYEFYSQDVLNHLLSGTRIDPKRDITFMDPTDNSWTRKLDCAGTDATNAFCVDYMKVARDNLFLNDESSLEHNYGIIRNDFSKKPSYHSIQNIIKLLRDPLHNDQSKTASPGSLNISYQNRTDNVPNTNSPNPDELTSKTGNAVKVEKSLFQKHDGRYYLTLHNNESHWINHQFAQQIIKDALNPISLSISNTIKRVKVYDPGNYYNDYEIKDGSGNPILNPDLFDANGDLKPIYDSCATQNNGICQASPSNNIIRNFSKNTLSTTLDINTPDRVIILEITPEVSTTKVVGITTNKADGSYKAEEVIDIDVVFNSDVTIDGIPSLVLSKINTNPDTRAVYIKGSGTNTLTFRYTVQAGDNTDLLNYASVQALSVVNISKKDNPTEFASNLIDRAYARGAIFDPIDGSEIDYSLPDPTSTTNPYNFISANHISIDTIAPTVSVPSTTTLYPNMNIFIQAMTSDNMGDNITYNWSVIDTPTTGGAITIDNPGAKDINVKTSAPGYYRVGLSTTDKAGNQSNKNIMIDIHPLGDIDGEIDEEGKRNVNFSDFSLLLSNWGKPTNSMADIYRDDNAGIVNFTDFSILLSNWGNALQVK